MTDVNQLITDHLDIWASATEKKSSAGRGNGKAINLYGIEKLRELIFELAVRGKLVPQSGPDGDARQQLKEIEIDKRKALKRSKIKVVRGLSEQAGSLGFDVPANWEIVRLDDVAWPQAGFAFKSKSFNTIGNGLPLIRIRDVGKEFSGTFFAGDYRQEFLVGDGDYLISMDGEFRVRPWTNGPALLNQRVSRLVYFSEHVSPSFVSLALQFELSALQGVKAYTTVDHLSTKQIANASLPFPPRAEQHRIVAKVDELMGLCDALEAQAEDSLKAHQTLVETCLATLTNSQTPEDLTKNWTRLETHFDTLFTTEASVICLKEVVRQLGVRGKLLPQNEDDEGASVLLEKLLQGKSNKKKRGRGAVGESTATEPPCSLPKNWVWHRFGDFVEFQSKLVKPDGYQNFFQVAPDIIEKGTGRLIDQRTVGESGIRGPNNLFYSGQIIYSKIRPSLSKAVIAPYDGLCSADMYPLKALIDPDFLLLSILSEDFLVQVRKLENRIKMPKLNVGSLSSIHIAVPPLAEQSRIAEKVKTMFQLCDFMRTNIEKSCQCNIKIADTLTSKIH